MAVTRINNNQITDASAGNAYLGINAGTKVQNYSITAGKIANNLTYGSDLTITGNLTVQGTTTAVDTVNTLIQDPLITLADGQVSGTPTVDIGTIGLRGSQNSAVLGWKESALEFVTALSTTTVSNTTFTISSYANLHTGNLIAQGTTSLVGNLVGAVNATATITGGNLATPGTASAGGNITGANILTGGIMSSTGNATHGNVLTGGLISATGNISGANILPTGNIIPTANVTYNLGSATNQWKSLYLAGNTIYMGNIQLQNPSGNTLNITGADGVTGGNINLALVSASGNVTGGNMLTGGLISATGNATVGNISATNHTGTTVSVTGTVTAASTVGGVITGSSSSVTGTQTAASTVGGVITGSSASVTGAVTAASTVGGIITGTSTSVSGNITGGNVLTGGLVSATGNITASYYFGNGSQLTGVAASTSGFPVVAGTSNIAAATGGNIGITVGGTSNVLTVTSTGIVTSGTSSVSGNITGGNVLTGGLASATGTITGGNLATGGTASATGTITGGNLATGGTASAGGNVTGANILTGGLVSATGNVTGSNLNGAQVYSASTLTITNGSGNINLSPNGNVVLNNNYLTGLQLNPVGNTDAATKYYVDTMISSGISYHQPVNAASTTTMATTTGGTITYNQPNGVSNGVGATLKTTGSFNLVDTANIQNINSRILVKDEANAVFNGVYNWANSSTLIRTSDTDEYGPNSVEQLSINDYFFVTSGSVNAGSAWVVNSPSGVITFGSSNITFSQFSSSQTYSAGNGISINGTVISARVDNNTTAFDGSQNIIVKASANLTTPNIGAATGTSLSVTGTVTASSVVGGVITGTSTSVTGSQTAASTVGGVITGSSVSVTGTASAASTVGGVITGSSSSVTGTQTAASTVGGVITGSSTSVTGTTTAASVVGGVITGTSTSVTGSQTAASTVGGIITGTSVSTTGNISTAATSNIATGNISATGTQTAASTVGGVITGSSVSVTGTATAASTVGGVITGTSASLTGNVNAGNIINTGISSVTGNITAGNVLTGGQVSAVGNITANTGSYFIGNGSQLTGVTASTSGFPVVAGTSNIAAATNGNIGISIGGASNIGLFTLSGLTVVGAISANGNVTGGNINTGGQISATGNIVTGTNGFVGIGISTPDSELTILGNPQTVSYPITGSSTTQGTDLHITGADGSNTRITQDAFGTGSYVAFTGRSGRGTAASPTQSQSADALAQFTARGFSNGSLQFGNTSTGRMDIVAAENFTDSSRATNIVMYTTASGAITPTAVATFSSATGLSVTGGIAATGNANIANATFFVNSSTSTASFGNSTQTTNALVSFNSTNSILLPVGNTAQRPATGVTGMQRFNTTTNGLEVYNNSAWQTVGATVFTVIADQQFSGDGSNVAFTLNSTQTTNSCIVSINGVVQIPTTAYSVSGTNPTCVLTFTEAPATGDLIDVRQITTTTSVTSISNSSANAVVAVTDTAAQVNVTGDLSVSGTIIGGNINSSAITSGTSNVKVQSSGGPVQVTIGGTNIIRFTSAGIENSQANATGNIGNASSYFNTVFAKATSAQYADLAEKYTADAEYAPGTVVVFGGTAEVTVNGVDSDRRVAGVVSTNPSYIMNGTLEAEHVATVALTGRVPTLVVGAVKKGDLMVAAGLGRARAEADPKVGTVIGKSLEDFEGTEGTIEVVVGRF